MTTPSHDDPPETVAAFIEETLNELAELAARKGYQSLAATLTLAAMEARRAAGGPPEPTH